MKKIPKVVPGNPIVARSINGLVDAATEASHISVSPPLTLRDGPDGPRLSKEPDDGFWARLTGNSGDAYSYQEVTWFNGATVDVTGGRTGTTSTRPAYEANGITSLPVGWVDFLRPGAPGEYVFQSIRSSQGGGPPDPDCYCWTEGTAPTTLAWTYVAKRPNPLGGYVTLGTTSGTLTWTSNVTFGTTSCGILTSEPSAPGWIGQFTYYTTGLPGPDDEITSALVSHCSSVFPEGQTTTQRCRWLAVLCNVANYDVPTGSGNPQSRLQLLYTINGTFETCVRQDLYLYASPDISGLYTGAGTSNADDCDPFLLVREYQDGSILTITE